MLQVMTVAIPTAESKLLIIISLIYPIKHRITNLRRAHFNVIEMLVCNSFANNNILTTKRLKNRGQKTQHSLYILFHRTFLTSFIIVLLSINQSSFMHLYILQSLFMINCTFIIVFFYLLMLH